MPPWFEKLMRGCEHLSLDSQIDRRLLWTYLKANLPREAIEAALSDSIHETRDAIDLDEIAAGCSAAVMRALEEA